jgi:hypothetical protein
MWEAIAWGNMALTSRRKWNRCLWWYHASTGISSSEMAIASEREDVSVTWMLYK